MSLVPAEAAKSIRSAAEDEGVYNSALIKMFNLINIGERAGSGIPNIYSVWEKSGWEAPIITESFSPDRIQFSLAIKKIGDKKS